MKIVQVSNVSNDPILHSKVFLFHPVRLLLCWLGTGGWLANPFPCPRVPLLPMWLYLLVLILVLLIWCLPFFLSS